MEQIAKRIAELSDKAKHLTGISEAQTCAAIVLPFIRDVLGYDTDDPHEVEPEHLPSSNFGVGNAVDYCIIIKGKPQILIEAKRAGLAITPKFAKQLADYFNHSNASIGILTNGTYWRIYTDLDKPNIMDSAPFLEFNLDDVTPDATAMLELLTKEHLDIGQLRTKAESKKYTMTLIELLRRQLANPDDETVRYLASRVRPGKLDAASLKRFVGYVADALSQIQHPEIIEPEANHQEKTLSKFHVSQSSTHELTEAEIEGTKIVRKLLAPTLPTNRIIPRAVKSYTSINVDDNDRRPICRLYFRQNSGIWAGLQVQLYDGEQWGVKLPIWAAADMEQWDKWEPTLRAAAGKWV